MVLKNWEAVKALSEGKKVRCRHWETDIWIAFFNGRVRDASGDIVEDILNDLWREDWEIYEERQRTYSWMEVVEGLKKGKNFRRPSWAEDRIIFCPPLSRQIWFSCERGLAVYGQLSIEDCEATDWVEGE